MGEGQGSAGEKVETQRDRTPEQVREDIDQTRAELGDTVAQLAAKTDVKAQAHRAVDNAKATVTGKTREVKSSAGTKKDEIATTARDTVPPSAEAARRQMISQAQQHRLALVGVLAFGAGMLIGKRRA
jgi:transposase-like protein